MTLSNLSKLAFCACLLIVSACTSSKYTYQAQQARKANKGIVKNPTPIKETDTHVKEEETTEVVPVVAPASTAAARLNKVLKTADSYMGTRHVLGGESRKGIDCSGLMIVSFKEIDMQLPRTAAEQSNKGKAVRKNELQVGDLLFFTYPGGSRITHVGMVVQVNGGDDVTFIHTSSSKGVRKDKLSDDYWRKTYVKARRLL